MICTRIYIFIFITIIILVDWTKQKHWHFHRAYCRHIGCLSRTHTHTITSSMACTCATSTNGQLADCSNLLVHLFVGFNHMDMLTHAFYSLFVIIIIILSLSTCLWYYQCYIYAWEVQIKELSICVMCESVASLYSVFARVTLFFSARHICI